MNPSAQGIANHLWQSTLFAVVAALLTLVLRRNQARVRYALWLAASLKFLIPCSLLVDLGSHLATRRVWPSGQSGFYSAVQEIGQPFTFVVETNASSRAHLLSLLFATVWLSGVLTVLGFWLFRWHKVAATVNRSVPIRQGRELEALRSVEQSAGWDTPIAFLSAQDSLEPGIFGIFRPVLLWPASISEKLDDSHLKAILAHEVSHVRRRDNLAGLLHMAVEALFWFHPMVWWLGARLLEERERACDEEVLRSGYPPAIYAEGILKTCEYCVGSPLACVSGVTGADLKQRIVRIMTERRVERLGPGRRLLLACLGIAVVTGPILFGLLKRSTRRSTNRGERYRPATSGDAGADLPRRRRCLCAETGLRTRPGVFSRRQTREVSRGLRDHRDCGYRRQSPACAGGSSPG